MLFPEGVRLSIFIWEKMNHDWEKRIVTRTQVVACRDSLCYHLFNLAKLIHQCARVFCNVRMAFRATGTLESEIVRFRRENPFMWCHFKGGPLMFFTQVHEQKEFIAPLNF